MTAKQNDTTQHTNTHTHTHTPRTRRRDARHTARTHAYRARPRRRDAAAVPLVVMKGSLSGDVKDAGPRVIDRTLRTSSRTTTRLDARSRTYLAKSFP